MSNSLDRICTVDISLASPISNDANFDNILILGPAPANPTEDVPAVGVYNSLEELTALGIAATGERADPVGVAARVAFSQSPRPHEVYVAFMGDIVDKESEDPALQTVSAVLENALAVNGWYCICPVGLEDEQVKELFIDARLVVCLLEPAKYFLAKGPFRYISNQASLCSLRNGLALNTWFW